MYNIYKNKFLIQCISNNKVIAIINNINMSITKEMIPPKNINIINFGRQKQGIAGVLTFNKIFDKSELNIFNIIITSENNISYINNVEIIKEGSIVSINKLNINEQYTFIAKNYNGINNKKMQYNWSN